MLTLGIYKAINFSLQKIDQKPYLGLNLKDVTLEILEKNFLNFLKDYFVIDGNYLKLNNYVKIDENMLQKEFHNYEPSLSYLSSVIDGTLCIDQNLFNFMIDRFEKKEFVQFFLRRIYNDITHEVGPLDENVNRDIIQLELFFYSFYLHLCLKYWKTSGLEGGYVYDKKINLISVIPYEKLDTKRFKNIVNKKNIVDGDILQIVNINFKKIQNLIEQIQSYYNFNMVIFGKFIHSLLYYNDATSGIIECWRYMHSNSLKTEGNMLLLSLLWKISFIKEGESSLISGFIKSLGIGKNEELQKIYEELNTEKHIDEISTPLALMFFYCIDIIYAYNLVIKGHKSNYDRYSSGDRRYKGLKFFNKEYYQLLQYIECDYSGIKSTFESSNYTQEQFDTTVTKYLDVKIDIIKGEKNQDVTSITIDKVTPIKQSYLIEEEREIDIKGENLKEKLTQSSTEKQHSEKPIPTYRDIYEGLRKKIRGQDEILLVISKKIHSYLFLKKGNSAPLNLFFMGPPGTGKTYLATVLKEVLNELSNEKFLAQKESMENYTSKESLTRLIGASKGYAGYGEQINMFETMMQGKNHILIFDEIEKGPREFFTFLLNFMNDGQISSMDEQYAINMIGNKHSFERTSKKQNTLSNVIIIYSSNIFHTTDDINEFFQLKGKNKFSITRDINEFEQNFNVYHGDLKKALIGKGTDSAFADRLNGVFMFNKLSEESIKEIINEEFKLLIKEFSIGEDLKKKVYEGFKQEFIDKDGARERLIQLEGIRGLKNYLNDWISGFIQESL